MIVARAGDPPVVLRQHQQLWQDTELIYKLHFANGASVRPGTYTLRSEHALTSYQIDDFQIPAVDRQQLETSAIRRTPATIAAGSSRSRHPVSHNGRVALFNVTAAGNCWQRAGIAWCRGRGLGSFRRRCLISQPATVSISSFSKSPSSSRRRSLTFLAMDTG